MKKFLIISVVLSVLIGCASQQQQPVTTASVGPAHPVYGKLEEVDGRYQFTEFMAYGPIQNTNQPWVRLSDRKPMWPEVQEGPCWYGAPPEKHSGIVNPCKKENKRLFHMGQRTKLSTSNEVFLGVVSYGLITAKTKSAGASYGIVSLDQELLDQAYTEALAAKGLTPDKAAAYAQQIAESKAAINDLYSVRQAFQDAYNKDNTKSLVLVNDKTNINKHKNTNFGKYIEIYPPVFTPIKSELRNTSLTKLVLDAQFMPGLLTVLWEEEAKDISCKGVPQRVHGYSVEISCMSFLAPDGVYTTSATVDINSYLSVDLVPDAVHVADRSVAVSLEAGSVYVNNKSSAYIDVSNLSFHYADRLATVNMDSLAGRKLKGLAPGQRVWLGSLDNVFTRYNIVSGRFDSKSQAISFTEKYGFSVRYRMNGQVHNLHQTKRFSGYDML